MQMFVLKLFRWKVGMSQKKGRSLPWHVFFLATLPKYKVNAFKTSNTALPELSTSVSCLIHGLPLACTLVLNRLFLQ